MGSTVNKSCKKHQRKTKQLYVFRADILPGRKECTGVGVARMPAMTETEVLKRCLGDNFWSYSCLSINGSPLSAK